MQMISFQAVKLKGKVTRTVVEIEYASYVIRTTAAGFLKDIHLAKSYKI